MSSKESSYRIKKKLWSDSIEIPRKLIAKLSDMGENEIKIFLLLASIEAGEEYTEEDELFRMADEAGFNRSDFSEALAFLRGAGLIEKPSAPRKAVKEEKEKKKESPVVLKPISRPSYTAKELAEAVEKREFKELVDYTSARLGKVLGNPDLSTLFSFHDYLCLPLDVVMLAIEHCASEGKTSLRYVEKLLIDFADKGINTYQKAEDYILSRKRYLSFEGNIRTMLGLGTRSLTAKESAMVSEWLSWKLSKELLRLAYEKTVSNTNKVSMSYMHKILESWHDAGFKTVADVERGDVKKPDSKDSFDPDEFFKAALERSKK